MRSIKPEMAGSASLSPILGHFLGVSGRVLGILGPQELPSSSDPVPPAPSPWHASYMSSVMCAGRYEEAQDSITDIWNGLKGFQA